MQCSCYGRLRSSYGRNRHGVSLVQTIRRRAREVMSNKMWGGRFTERPDAIMEEINVSIDVDRHLYAQDIAASKAHAAMLSAQGIITASDAKNIGKGLDTILSEIDKGSFDFKRALEDIHMNVESRLSRTDRSGRGTAAHRALAQRPGGDRFPPLCPRHHRRDRCGAGRVPARAGRAGRWNMPPP